MSYALPLSQGQYAVIDDIDVARVMQFKWTFQSPGYGYRRDRNAGKKIYLHRFINDSPDGALTDHINGNGLDNRRANLRTCLASQNAANKAPMASVSGRKGVHWHKGAKRWMAQITVNYRKHYLGLFDNQEDAAWAYQLAAEQHFGSFARTN